jgi:uncharacterized protein
MPLAPLEGEPDPNGADCVACGRCCHHGPQTVALHDADERRMGEAKLRQFTMIEPRGPGFRFMRNDGERCYGLDMREPGKYPCGVYDARPEGCRVVEPGSPCCLEARAKGHLGNSVDFTRKKPPAM